MPHPIDRITRLFLPALLVAAVLLTTGTAQSQSDWPMFGHDDASTRYSPLDQINTGNVTGLKQAWTYHITGTPPPPTNPSRANASAGSITIRRASEAMPIEANGLLYFPTPFGTVVAIDPDTGKEAWSFKLPSGIASRRGVAFWQGDKITSPSIVFGTSTGRLYSLDAATGKPQPGFGKDGFVDVKTPEIMNGNPNGRWNINSPPIVYKNLIIIGSQVQESPSRGTSGDTRAWDAHTGKLVWQFHSVPHPGETGNETWPADGWQNRSGTNAWGFMSIDDKRGLLYMPMGSATYDFYGADRKGNDLFANSIVALHADTGKLAWYFQAVHHDVEDYDLESAPVLIDVKKGMRKIPALAAIGKTGLMYILDRTNGKPVFGVEERPIPQSEIPGEQSSPTQPFPVKPEPLGRHSFNASELNTLTPELAAACKKVFDTEEGGLRSGGPFTPFGSKLTVIFPGTIGATNWQGMSYDPKLGYLFVNTMDLGDIGKIAKNPNGTDPPYTRQSPWGLYARFWDEKTFIPCQQPPWGLLWAINVNTGDVAWKIPFGTVPELEAKGITGTGAPNYGGSIVTAGGLLFIAATNDQIFRAYDAANGKELWKTKLETGSYDIPMTFRGKSGKQYVLLVVTGGSYYDRTGGDSVVAFSLP